MSSPPPPPPPLQDEIPRWNPEGAHATSNSSFMKNMWECTSLERSGWKVWGKLDICTQQWIIVNPESLLSCEQACATGYNNRKICLEDERLYAGPSKGVFFHWREFYFHLNWCGLHVPYKFMCIVQLKMGRVLLNPPNPPLRTGSACTTVVRMHAKNYNSQACTFRTNYVEIDVSNICNTGIAQTSTLLFHPTPCLALTAPPCVQLTSFAYIASPFPDSNKCTELQKTI